MLMTPSFRNPSVENHPFKKISTLFVLIFFVVSNYSQTLYARSEEKSQTQSSQEKKVGSEEKMADRGSRKKDHILKDRFSGKKLERVKTSIRGKDGYRLLIRTTDGPNAIDTSFGADKKTKIRKVGDGMYLVSFSRGNKSFSGELSKLESDTIPSTLGSYDVVEPEVFEALGSGYLS